MRKSNKSSGKSRYLMVSLAVILLFFICKSVIKTANSQGNTSGPVFQFPVGCDIGRDCRISEYPDDDPGPDRKDYTGGRHTYNGHTGTDIALDNIKKMDQGVPVYAAAKGVVVATRDGVQDINAKKIGEAAVINIGCGNRVAISHGNGWLTDYCHMKKGSIKVRKGDKIYAGQKLGYIGMSGLTELPHLHFQVQRFNETIDPFTGMGLDKYNLTGNTTPMWDNKALSQIKYYPSLIYNVGISQNKPDILEIQSGNFEKAKISTNTPGVYFWVDMLNVEKGDNINFLVTDPRGKKIINKQYPLDKSNVRRFISLKHKHNAKWEPGTYNAKVILSRPSDNFSYTRETTFYVKG